MEPIRKPLQGVMNIIRFNWHYFALSGIAIILMFALMKELPELIKRVVGILILLTFLANCLPLLISFYIYDRSNLYKLDWLDSITFGHNIINISAGFDETSHLLKKKYPGSHIDMLDFYDPVKHTELSIRRARNAYPLTPGTKHTNTTRIILPDEYGDNICLIFSAHEIRNSEERNLFFKELNRVLTSEGTVIVTEHLRDLNNFLAYNVGFMHFYSKITWLSTFDAAGFTIAAEIKITPFVTTFILRKNGAAS